MDPESNNSMWKCNFFPERVTKYWGQNFYYKQLILDGNIEFLKSPLSLRENERPVFDDICRVLFHKYRKSLCTIEETKIDRDILISLNRKREIDRVILISLNRKRERERNRMINERERNGMRNEREINGMRNEREKKERDREEKNKYRYIFISISRQLAERSL